MNSNGQATAGGIIERARAAKENLQSRENQLLGDIRQLQLKEADGTLTAQEVAKLLESNAELESVRHAIGKLGIVTAQALDSNEETKRIIAELRDVTNDLVQHMTDLDGLADTIVASGTALEEAEEILKKIAKISEKLKKGDLPFG